MVDSQDCPLASIEQCPTGRFSRWCYSNCQTYRDLFDNMSLGTHWSDSHNDEESDNVSGTEIDELGPPYDDQELIMIFTAFINVIPEERTGFNMLTIEEAVQKIKYCSENFPYYQTWIETIAQAVNEKLAKDMR